MTAPVMEAVIMITFKGSLGLDGSAGSVVISELAGNELLILLLLLSEWLELDEIRDSDVE